MNTTDSLKEKGARAAGIIGLIALVLLGLWGIYQIALYIPGVVGGVSDKASSIFSSVSTTKETLVATAPANTQSDTPFTISWKHDGEDGTYSYLVAYSCAAGVSFDAPVATGNSQAVPCNTAFNYTNAKDSLSLVPHVRASAPVAVEMSVFANKLSTGAITSVATTTVTITPSTLAATPTRTTNTAAGVTAKPATVQTNTARYIANTKRATLYGLPDLAVRILSVDFAGDHRYNARFVVENVGTNRTPSTWIFSARLPSGYIYTSDPQQMLNPGDSIAFTLGFTDTDGGNTYYPPNNCNTVYQTYPYMYPCNTQSYYSYSNNCGYAVNYTYDGVYNYPSTAYGCNNQYQQPYCYAGNCGYNTPYIQPPHTNVHIFSITVDPQQWITEQSEANNTASTQF